MRGLVRKICLHISTLTHVTEAVCHKALCLSLLLSHTDLLSHEKWGNVKKHKGRNGHVYLDEGTKQEMVKLRKTTRQPESPH